jgi:hypothetical protein
VLGLPLVGGIGLTSARVGETARFVTWPITAFTVLAAAVALLALWIGLDQPWLLAAGVLPGLVLSYVLPAAPVAFVTIVLVAVAVLAVRARGIGPGVAFTVGIVMVIAVVAQGPAVECGETSVSAGGGPWWMPAPSSSSSSGTSDANGRSSGSTQVGNHRYVFTCAGAHLTEFHRAD